MNAEAGANILVVDDNHSNCLIVAAILEDAGYSAITVNDPELAADRARAEKPDLILLDVLMPGMSGHEVCKELNSDADSRAIPVIFLSSLSDPRDKITGLECGAVDFITKPFDPGEVLARVRGQLRLDRLIRQLEVANRALEKRQERLDEDLRSAARIQRILLPKEGPKIESVRVTWRFAPCDPVGGDLFNVEQLDERHLAAHVVDVSGHGVPAAMMTVAVAEALGHKADRRAQSWRQSPAQALYRLDREFPVERFERSLTACYMVLDTTTGDLRYSRAGHPRPALSRVDGRIEFLDIGGPPIGLDGLVPFESGATRLQRGERVFLYTDGLLERFDAEGRQWGEAGLAAAIQQARGLELDAACDAILDNSDRFDAMTEQQDDLTIVAIEFTGTGVRQFNL